MQKKINIITGKIRAGKTTFIKKQLLSSQKYYGILQPQINNRRFFQNIATGEEREITSVTEEKNTFKLGKFIFNQESFNWAKSILEELYKKDSLINVIIDEFGPLEFSGEGLEPEVSLLMLKTLQTDKLILTVVVREKLLQKFIDKYSLNNNDFDIVKVSA